jgi:hypothetical protein
MTPQRRSKVTDLDKIFLEHMSDKCLHPETEYIHNKHKYNSIITDQNSVRI